MYSDAPEAAAAPPSEEAPAEKEGEEGTGETALVPSSLCPGMKAGDEMVVKIDRVLENQYEVSYAPEKGKGEAPPPAAEPAGDGGMASMME